MELRHINVPTVAPALGGNTAKTAAGETVIAAARVHDHNTVEITGPCTESPGPVAGNIEA